MELTRLCGHCGGELPVGATRRRVFCSARCKKRGWRRQQAGLPEHAFQAGGLRGRVPLGEPTRRERAVSVLLVGR